MRADVGELLSLDGRVLLFTVAISVVTGVVFGLLPAIRASLPDVQEALKVGGRQSSAGFGRNSLKGALVAAEVALAVVTLIGAGLFLRSMNEALKIDPGFRTENVFMFAMNLGSRGMGPEESRQFIDEALARAEATPGVEFSRSRRKPFEVASKPTLQGFVGLQM